MALAKSLPLTVSSATIERHAVSRKAPPLSRHLSPLSYRLPRVGLVLLLVCTALLAGTIESAQAATGPRAMWVWSFGNASNTVKFAKAHGVTQLFISVPDNVTTSSQLPRLRDLSSKARAAGLRVDALGGHPSWIDNPTAVVDGWLKPAIATGLFTGIHVDIEPYTTPAWTSDQAGVVSRYLSTLSTLAAAAGPASPIEADIPFWFNQIPAGSGSTLDQEIIRRTAGITIMAYRNTAAGDDGTIALAAPELAAARLLGKPARIGQETNYLGSDPVAAKQTFYGWTRTQMETQLALVQSAYAGNPSYSGLAIHDYTGYASMKR